MRTLTGLEVLLTSAAVQKSIKGNIAYLCHSASITSNLTLGIFPLKKLFGSRLKKLFSPQHGLFGDVQANMIETEDNFQPFFKLPVVSLYSKRRSPTPETLKGIDTLIVDLQDVGTRIYTYIWTLSLAIEACAGTDIEVVVLDRPNPLGGRVIEGNVLDPAFSSFIGRYPIPVRHSLTIGEVAEYSRRFFAPEARVRVIRMKGWKRRLHFHETGLPWVLPSPNLPVPEACIPYVGAVLFEGTAVSEGRGTTRPFEIMGHPKIEPFSFQKKLEGSLKRAGLTGFVLRPMWFIPTFDKHHCIPCGGYQLHVTNREKFRSWKFFQIIMRDLFHELGSAGFWRDPPYEYEYEKLPIDILNGSDRPRLWVERRGGTGDLEKIEKHGLDDFLDKRERVLLYS